MKGAVVLILLAALALGGGAAYTSGSTVPATTLGTTSQATGANQVKPSECAALAPTVVVNAAGTYTAPNGVNGLLLGSSGIDRITGRNGDECIVGGGSADVINGGNGTDVCIGGPGIDTFSNCETQIQ